MKHTASALASASAIMRMNVVLHPSVQVKWLSNNVTLGTSQKSSVKQFTVIAILAPASEADFGAQACLTPSYRRATRAGPCSTAQLWPVSRYPVPTVPRPG
jgi:hypothetical protein